MFAVARLGVPGMYVLPTDTWRNTFVANRIDRCIQNTPLYKNNAKPAKKDADSRGLKTLFGVNWKFVGSQQRGNFYEFPAGTVIIDEYDLCNQDNIIYALDRLAAAERPRVREFGNPTNSGRGIAEEYERSDQKTWHLKCPACNAWQIPGWFAHFVEQGDDGWRLRGGASPDMICTSCGKPMDRLARGQWVAKYPDRKISGYQVSRLFGDVRPIVGDLFDEWLDAQYNQTKLQRFHNNVLGLPYESSGNKITEADIKACMADYGLEASCERPCIAGADVGGVIHLKIAEVVDNEEILRWAGTVPTFAELKRVCRLFNVQLGVIDWLPDTHSVRDFIWAADTPGVWYGCRYHPTPNISDFKVDHRELTVTVDRTQSLDAHHESWLRKEQRVPRGWETIDNGEWVKQMTAPVRQEVEKPSGNVYVWDEGGKPDHHCHAGNYCHIAKQIYQGAGCGVEVL